MEKIFPKSQREGIKFFHLRGGIHYKKLSLVHKFMMAMLRNVTAKKPKDKLTDEEKEFLLTYEYKVYFTDKSTIIPIVNYISNVIEILNRNLLKITNK